VVNFSLLNVLIAKKECAGRIWFLRNEMVNRQISLTKIATSCISDMRGASQVEINKVNIFFIFIFRIC
jgi:hypothetical protein